MVVADAHFLIIALVEREREIERERVRERERERERGRERERERGRERERERERGRHIDRDREREKRGKRKGGGIRLKKVKFLEKINRHSIAHFFLKSHLNRFGTKTDQFKEHKTKT